MNRMFAFAAILWQRLTHAWMTPSAFRSNWRKYAINQLGHGLAVGVLPAAILGHQLAAVVLIAYAAWEYTQWQWRRAEASDCWEDWAFVACGAFFGLTGSLGFPVLMVAFLVAGILWRVEEHGA